MTIVINKWNVKGKRKSINGRETVLIQGWHLSWQKVFLSVISPVFTTTKAKVYKVYILTRLSLQFLLSQCRQWTALALTLRKEGNKFIEIL